MREANFEYQARILKVLRSANQPLDAESIRKKVGIGNWETCMRHLLELTILGAIQGQKTSKSWIFWVEKAQNEPPESLPGCFADYPHALEPNNCEVCPCRELCERLSKRR